MAKKVILKDQNEIEILPITRGELVLDSSGKKAFHSEEFLATSSQPGLMSKTDKTKVDNATTLSQALPYIVGNASDSAGTWTGSYTGINEYKDGLTIIYVPKVAGASTTTLNINNLGAKTCHYTGTSKLTTHYAANTPILLTYQGGYWKRADYNVDTYTSAYSVTSGGTAGKTASCTGYQLKPNSYTHITFTNTNTYQGALTLNINTRGAKPIWINRKASSSSNYTLPAGTYLAYYDGSSYHIRTDGTLPGTIEDSYGAKYISQYVNTTSSATTSKNKYYKFATINLTDANWSECSINFLFASIENAQPNGLLTLAVRRGNSITALMGTLNWLSLDDEVYKDSVVLCNTDTDGVYDLYFQPKKDYCTVRITAITPQYAKLQMFRGGYFEEVTPKITSKLSGYVHHAERITCTEGILNKDYPIISTSNASSGIYESLLYNPNITLNPSTGEVKATKFTGIFNGTSNQVANNLILKIKSGTTEGTNLYTYNGSSSKTLDIKQGDNITLTAAAGSLSIAASDAKVTQTNTTGSASYRVLFSGNANDTTETTTARKSNKLQFNPSSGKLTANTFVGNLSWDYITDKPTSFTPTAHTHNELTWTGDVRNVATQPSDYKKVFRFVGIKSPSVIGLTQAQAGYWVSLIGWKGYNDNSGPHSWELASTSTERIYVRSGIGIQNSGSGTEDWKDWHNIAYTTDNFPSNQITSLLEYSKATSAADLATTDTLNIALGKLEYKAHYAYNWINTVTNTDQDEYINKWGEIVDFLDSVKEGTDILEEFVTVKTAQTISGQKTFSQPVLIKNENDRLTKIYSESQTEGVPTGNAGTVIQGGNFSHRLQLKDSFAGGCNYASLQGGYSHDGKLILNSYTIDTTAVTATVKSTTIISTAASLLGGSLSINGDLWFPAGDNNRFINFTSKGNTTFGTNSWRLGYWGSESGDKNYFILQSTTNTTSTWKNAFRITSETLFTEFYGNVKSTKFITSGGTASQFVKGDGSLDSTSYATSASLGNYLPLAGGTMTGNVVWKEGTGTGSRFPGHIYRNFWSTNGDVYDHFYPSGTTQTSNAYIRVWDGTTQSMRALLLAGSGSMKWCDKEVLHAGNYSNYLPTYAGNRMTKDTAFYKRYITVNGNNYAFVSNTNSSTSATIYAHTSLNQNRLSYSTASGLGYTTLKYLSFRPKDNSGYPVYLLIADLTNWVKGTNSSTYLIGTMYGQRGGNQARSVVHNICAHLTSYTSGSTWTLYTDIYNDRVLQPYVVTYNGTKYLALKKKSSEDTVYFVGLAEGLLDTYIDVLCPNNTDLPEGLTIKCSPTTTSMCLATTKVWDGTTSHNIIHSGNYTTYSGYIGTTKVQATGAEQSLTGIKNINASGTATILNQVLIGTATALKTDFILNVNGHTYQRGEVKITNDTHGLRLLGHGGAGYLQFGHTSDTTAEHYGHITGTGGVALTSLNIKSPITTFQGVATFKDRINVTNTSGTQYILMGNQNGNGVDKPAIIRAANGGLELGYGNSWSGIGGTFNRSFSVNASYVHAERPLTTANTAGSYKSGMTNAAIKYDNLENGSDASYHPILAVKTNSGNIFNIGKYNDSVGFYVFKSDRTENNYDYYFTCNTKTGDWTTGQYLGATGFKKSNSSDSYALLGGGGHKVLSDFALKSELNDLALSNNVITFSKEITVGSDWVDTGIVFNSTNFPQGNGSYLVQLSYGSSSYIYTGVLSVINSQAVSKTRSEEILLHGGGFDAGSDHVYLRTYGDATDKVFKLQIARSATSGTRTYTFKFIKLL